MMQTPTASASTRAPGFTAMPAIVNGTLIPAVSIRHFPVIGLTERDHTAYPIAANDQRRARAPSTIANFSLTLPNRSGNTSYAGDSINTLNDQYIARLGHAESAVGFEQITGQTGDFHLTNRCPWDRPVSCLLDVVVVYPAETFSLQSVLPAGHPPPFELRKHCLPASCSGVSRRVAELTKSVRRSPPPKAQHVHGACWSAAPKQPETLIVAYATTSWKMTLKLRMLLLFA